MAGQLDRLAKAQLPGAQRQLVVGLLLLLFQVPVTLVQQGREALLGQGKVAFVKLVFG
nr:hypothetical protein [Tanacetum cinerariifolium]